MRLIDADELKDLLGENITVLKFNQDFDGLLADIIDNTPTADEEEIAQWFVRDGYPHRVYCSRCKETFCDERWEVWKDGSLPRAYCPSCGAKMLPTLFKNKEES